MGRRSRKRTAGAVPPPPRESSPAAARPAPRAATHRARLDEAPKPPWAPFPLTELVSLLAIVLLIVGFLTPGRRHWVLVGGGVVLITLSGGELALREHFSGYRSHTSLLAGMCAILAAVPVWFLPVPQEVVLAVGIVVFAFAFVHLRRAFVRRSGGVGFRA